MAEFRTLYYGPMDREYHQAISETQSDGPKLEDPIFPINRLGETVPEHDPSGRFKNIIQTTQAAIRGGAGTIQLVMMTPPESAIGGRPKAYGKEVREALKEVALASKVNIAGVELPTALNNLAGFDYQNLVFSDEKRKQSLDEVKDAIKFAADVGRGGGVDIVSWEFPRGINEAPWQEKDPLSKGKFEQVGEQRIGWLVDDRTGRTIQFRKDEVQHIPYDKKTFEEIKPKAEELGKPGEMLLQPFEWEDFKEWAKKEGVTPEQKYIEVQLKGQINSLLGWRTHYKERAAEAYNAMEEHKRIMEEAQREGNREAYEKEKLAFEKAEAQYKDYLNTANSQEQQAKELQERIKHLKPIEEYALKRSAETYAEAGIAAMKIYEEGRAKGTVERPLYVGPEIGWPGYFGSHPDEFLQLIKSARKEMVNLLTTPKREIILPSGEKKIEDNPYFDRSMDKKRAEELASKHIKGLFDTSHMGMWLAHFKPLPGESEEQRIKRFNQWYVKEAEKLAKSGCVGGIQLVDSMSAAHGHLPPGEGIFPVIETAKIFKDNNFSGFLVSEGHEEEKFGEGRIRMKTWQHAGANIGAGYFAGPPLRWSQVQHGYFGRTYSPLFMFGGYSPSNEFKLWSEVPLE
ncbi:MAG: hypothetical protein QW165_04785 [Candidatus Woesearchaeota archaeon]